MSITHDQTSNPYSPERKCSQTATSTGKRCMRPVAATDYGFDFCSMHSPSVRIRNLQELVLQLTASNTEQARTIIKLSTWDCDNCGSKNVNALNTCPGCLTGKDL